MDPQHDQIRSLLRAVGPVILVVGIIFTIVGFGSVLSTAFGRPTFGPPRLFWCAFVGIPLMGLGGVICKFAFIGAVSRYIADEVAPVGKDVVNYMAEGTQDAVRTVAAAVGEGLRGDSVPGSAYRSLPQVQRRQRVVGQFLQGLRNVVDEVGTLSWMWRTERRGRPILRHLREDAGLASRCSPCPLMMPP